MPGTKLTIFILGASGFLGGRAAEYFSSLGHTVITDRVDVTDRSALDATFARHKPQVVMNFAGVRAYPNIDWCETHVEETIAVNVVGATNVMLAALAAHAYPIQLASGCIYTGGPEYAFKETDAPNFHGSLYSRMRIALEAVLADLPVLVARIRMPLSSEPNPRNLIDKLISYQKVISVPNSVTVIEDLFPALAVCIEKRITGTLNLTNRGFVTHDDILKAYQRVVDQNHTYSLIDTTELERSLVKAPRSNCVLNTTKAETFGIYMPPIDKERLETMMIAYLA